MGTRELVMKKKLAILALALVMMVTPAFAAGGAAEDDLIGVGLNLGTNTGVALRFGLGDFDILSNLGFSMLRAFEGDFGMSGDVAFSWNFYTIDGGRGLEFPLTVGLGANVDIDFSHDWNTDFSILFPIGIEYDFAQLNSDVPITVYFRFAPGFSIIQNSKADVGFAYGVYLGAMWNF